MSTVEQIALEATTTGSAGSAAATVVSPVFTNGAEILRAWYDYHASAPNTTDVTLYETALGATLGAIDAKANSVTDAVRRPRVSSLQDLAGADLSANEVTEPYMIPAGGTVTLTVAQSDALTNAVVCYIQYRRLA